jgi:catechol 2,3-dioxygenase-like lactoylglutathione lyase family enzyme
LAVPAQVEDECRTFWSGLLGLTEVDKPAVLAARGGCWFRMDGLEVHLGVEQPFTPARKAHPGILIHEAAAFDQLAERLRATGYLVEFDGDFPGYRRFYTADPFGNRLEFLTPIAGPSTSASRPSPDR